MPKEILNITKNRLWSILIVLVVTFLAYANTLQNGFVIEDETFISNWQLTQNLSNIPKMIAGDTIPTGNWGAYRPVRAIIYAVSYQLFGGGNPFWYHLQALAVHLTITALVFLIAEKILKNRILAILVGLLFGLHPVHTEAVDYLTANFDIISYIFFFGSFLFYLYFKDAKKSERNFYYGGAIVLATLGFLSSEMTLTLPFLIVFYDFVFDKKIFQKPKWNQIFKQYGAFFGSALAFLFIRFVIMGINVRGEYLGGSIYFTFLTMLKVILKYFEWLIFPLNLSIDPYLPGGISAWNHPLSHPERILEQSLFEFTNLLSLSLIALLIFAAIYFWKKLPLITFSIGWFFIALGPVLHIIPQGTIFQERYIYIASFSYILLFCFLIHYLYNYKFKGDLKKVVQFGITAFLILLIAFYGVRTFLRNRDWKDSLAVWTTLAKQYPGEILGNFHSARLYQQANLDELAINYYNKTLQIEPRLFEVHYSLGQIYLKHAKFKEAEDYFKQVLIINPNLKSAVNVLENMEFVKQSSDSAYFKSNLNYIDYSLESFVFSFPYDWNIKENQELRIKNQAKVRIQDPNESFTIELEEFPKNLELSLEEFVKLQDITYGKLINQGPAQIPYFDESLVKVWQDPSTHSTKAQGRTELDRSATSSGQVRDILKLEFYLLKEKDGDTILNRVVKALVYPGDSPFMGVFDNIISSLRLKD